MCHLIKDTQQIEMLYDLGRSVSPWLNGTVKPVPQKSSIVNDDTLPKTIGALYQHIRSNHLAAGRAYWLTRTWDLISWQPIAMAVIAAEELSEIPRFNRFCQIANDGVVSGFWMSASFTSLPQPSKRLDFIANDLVQLLTAYQVALNQTHRCRPGFTRRLIADALIDWYHRYNMSIKRLDSTLISERISQWFYRLKIPTRLQAGLSFDHDDNIIHHRTSCCLAYRCDATSICKSCPHFIKTNAQKSELLEQWKRETCN